MSVAVRISNELINKARSRSKALNRSVAGQIEFWAKIGEISEDNQDLSFTFIKDILIAKEQIKNGEVSTYVFGEGD
ncbi:MAG: hypothetical protein KAI81_03970 [Candidatus Marinimicrobia bacterium]|nr:hypothetical protein [Candidatus Neomarinimicrobiota bacterium]